MKIRTFLLLPLLTLGHAAPDQPNIVFIIGDDMDRFMFNFLLDAEDPDALEGRIAKNFTGRSVLSPNLDTLASGGMTFGNQYVVTPACTPSRYAVLTGRYGSRGTNTAWDQHGGMRYPYFNMAIESTDTTIASLLKAAGYRTGFVGKDHASDVTPPTYDNSIPDDADPDDPAIRVRLEDNVEAFRNQIMSYGFDFAGGIYPKNPAVLPKAIEAHNMDWIAKHGVDFIDDCAINHADQPFFLHFATTLTHAPNNAGQAWQFDPRATPQGFVDFTSPLPDRSTIPIRMEEAGLPIGRLDQVLWLDDAVGALIERLEAHGLDDNTIVVIFNDHGVEFGGKASLYERGVRSASLVWRKGGWPGGGSSDAILSNIDFAPTLLDLAGVEVPLDHFDGRSFRPVLEGEAEEIRKSSYFEIGCARGILMDGWKYISVRWPDTLEDPVADGLGWASLRAPSDLEQNVKTQYAAHYYDADQLYELANDRGEQANVAADPANAARLERMKLELTRYLNELPGSYGEFKQEITEKRAGSVIELR